MAISDEERNEIARKLREDPERIGPGDLTDGELLDVIAADVGVRASCSDFDAKLMDRLADLIEPERETTEDVSDDYGKFECGKCGCRIDDVTAVDNGGINFCPDCGREVVE